MHASLETLSRSLVLVMAMSDPLAALERPRRDFPVGTELINVDGLKLEAHRGPLHFGAMPWEDLVRAATNDSKCLKAIQGWADSATNWAATELIRRVYRPEDIPKNNLDQRYRGVGTNAVTFMLAMTDKGTAHKVADRLLMASLAFRYDPKPEILGYLNRQFAEVASWYPIQRPGWSLLSPDAVLPPGGHDGPWLAEGESMPQLALALNLVGKDLDPAVLAAMRQLMQKEVQWIARAWNEKIPWFVKHRAYRSNQWAWPTCALVMGCLYLGDDGNRDIYELGVLNLAKTLASQGESGSWAEGYAYAQGSMMAILPTLWAMERSGDPRLVRFPFVRNYARWSLQMALPNRWFINCGDSGSGTMPVSPRNDLTLGVLVSKDPRNFWGLDQLFPSGLSPLDPYTLVYELEAPSAAASRPPLETSAFFPNQQLAVWRSDWDLDRAMVVWAKGGTKNDAHEHNDKGQIAVFNGREPILVETGSGSYADPDYLGRFSSCAGHNVLQTPSGRKSIQSVRVPVDAVRLETRGGSLRIDGSESAPEIRSWIRSVNWSIEGWVEVKDKADLFTAKAAGDEWFRWHTGATNAPTVSGGDKEWTVTWGGNRMILTGDASFMVESMPWFCLNVKGNHVLIIRATRPGNYFSLTTSLRFTREEPPAR